MVLDPYSRAAEVDLLQTFITNDSPFECAVALPDVRYGKSADEWFNSTPAYVYPLIILGRAMTDSIMYQEASGKLLAAAFCIAPTGKEQNSFSIMVNEMILSGESNKSVVTALLQSMLDGIQHGNWPVKEVSHGDNHSEQNSGESTG